MELRILDEIAFLFVEQFDNLYGMLVDRSDVKRIRNSVDDGEAALFSVASEVFGEKLDQVILDAARNEMDYIAYVDETWQSEEYKDRVKTLEGEAFHLETVKAIVTLAQKHGCSTLAQIREVLKEAEDHFEHIQIN